jgi:protein-S-isoprenylcysteine O-methyltransferase Ste14
MPLPNQHARLRTRGLYRHVRHPIYSGLLLFGAAHTAGSGSIHQVGVLALLTGLLSGKARWEEARLRPEFPGYTEYALTTPKFIPRLRFGAR